MLADVGIADGMARGDCLLLGCMGSTEGLAIVVEDIAVPVRIADSVERLMIVELLLRIQLIPVESISRGFVAFVVPLLPMLGIVRSLIL